MISWDRLRVFDAVAEHGSVGAAAAALHITGPAVTQQLRKLERETGTRLVEPDGRGIRLTAAGHVLAGHAAAAAATVAGAERDLAALHDDAAGPLRIGSVASALRTLLPEVIDGLAAAHPGWSPPSTTARSSTCCPPCSPATWTRCSWRAGRRPRPGCPPGSG